MRNKSILSILLVLLLFFVWQIGTNLYTPKTIEENHITQIEKSSPPIDKTSPTKDTTKPATDTTVPTKDTTKPTTNKTPPTTDTTKPTEDIPTPATPTTDTNTANTDTPSPDTDTPLVDTDTKDSDIRVKLQISCHTILDNIEELAESKRSFVPSDGILFPMTTLAAKKGDSAHDLLLRTVREANIHMEFSTSPFYQTTYIEGIGNLYEFDLGELSGWMYKVNNIFPNYGISAYTLEDGDVLELLYTCDLGTDVGGNNFAQE